MNGLRGWMIGGWMIFTALLVAVSACGSDEVSGTDYDCPDGECVDCDEDADCAPGLECHEEGEVCVEVGCDGDEDCESGSQCEGGVCVVLECSSHADCGNGAYCDDATGQCARAICEPGETTCDGAAVLRCDDAGSGFEQFDECASGVCQNGQCGCAGADDCAPGESCSDGVCQCPSGVSCGPDAGCCASDEVCAVSEVCDDEGECQQFQECRPECEGEVCGLLGELCCDGSEPVCGPDGSCAPDCSDAGELCGADFDSCCSEGDVCIFGDCVSPGEQCEHFTDCGFDEYCDEGLGRCLPDDFPEGLVCEEDYDFAEIEPEVLWQWDGVDVDGVMYSNVMMTPLVADMDGNGTPNVVFNAYREDGGGGGNSVPVVADGATGDTIYFNAQRFTNFGAQLAVADVTGNGYPEIVGVDHQAGGIGVYRDIVNCPDPEADDDGCVLWWNDEDVYTDQGAPVVADLNADGNVEIILRETILEATTGEVIAVLDDGGYDYTVAADVTGDGKLEILGEGCLYSLDSDRELTQLWCTDEPVADSDRKRYAAVGDVTNDGEPEFVLTGDGNVYVIAASDGTVLHQFPIYGGGSGGSPIIADFDGDGSAEFGIASANCYTVYDLDCVVPDADGDEDLMEDRPGCERPEIETCDYGHHCACEDLRDTMGTGQGVLWSIYVQDESSHRTGSSVFDFQGDGKNEVVYNDECLLMVLNGQDGSPYFLHGNTNRTSSEYPIIVDVNGDNRTNIVVSANNDEFARDCETPIATQPERFPECHPEDPDDEVPTWCEEGTHGVIALQDPEDRWVRTRTIWNHFDYYIDNTTDDAGVPTSPSMPWDSHNTFRANRQGEVPLNAPDPVVSSLQVHAHSCPPDIKIRATIENAGMSGIPEGMPVSLYLFHGGGQGELVTTEQIGQAISPGGMTTVDFVFEVNTSQLNTELGFQVVANDDGQGGAPIPDCNPDDASAMVDGVMCMIQL